MIRGGVALSDRSADSRDCVMASFEGCDILAIVTCSESKCANVKHARSSERKSRVED
jgi:hypothetical protein